MSNTLPVPEVNLTDRATFMAAYGGIFEHSPWIAGQVWDQGFHSGAVHELQAAFSDVIRNADRQRQLALLRAHPQLACAIASCEELTEESRGEQRGAGLDQCSAREFELFKQFNDSYTDKFGFPFIIAVKGLSRSQILEFFRTRQTNSPEEEFREALEQVIRIGTLRLRDVAAKQGSL
jgi:2-oxo-4-hydroxy-4-carboxy-5-ureidoimidazoline decarboxylase